LDGLVVIKSKANFMDNEDKLNISKPKVQANEITYELNSLGWKAFQNLCGTIITDIWGQEIQVFFDSKDGGRDGAFNGIWKTKGNELFQGSFTVQCKYFSKANSIIKTSHLKEEYNKASRLASRGLADNYFLFTNANLLGTNDEKIKGQFKSIHEIKNFVAYGCEWISKEIRESPRLRMLVPRVYGLGDLSQILDERAYDQAKEILSALGDDLKKFVITEEFLKSTKALIDFGFVIILGEPATGKSTIAAALSLGALDEWKCSTIKIRNADEFIKHFNPHEKQFFWVDDAFGTTQLDWSLVSGWNGAFPHIQAAIRRGTRVVFTSRDYIYQSAINSLKTSSFPLLIDSKVIIHVEKLTKNEREQILYNHIRLGTQSKDFKTTIKPFLPDVCIHPRFSPEIARRLGNEAFTKKLALNKEKIFDFIEHPTEFLCEVIRTLDIDSQSAIALIFMREGILPSPVVLNCNEERAMKLMGGTLSGITKALQSLNNSLLIHSYQNGIYIWKYKHPTIRDAFATLISENIELMEIYLLGTPIERLFNEITCGDVGLRGVKVIVPDNHFNTIIERIETINPKNYDEINKLYYFLAYRCNREFLIKYIAENPNFISSLHVGSYLIAIPDVHIISKLYKFGLLPEEKRSMIVEDIRNLAVDTPDSGFLQKWFPPLLEENEIKEILEYVREELIPNLDNIITDWLSNYDEKREPDEYFDDLKTSLEDYYDECEGFKEAQNLLETALLRINHIVDDLLSERPGDLDDDDDYPGSLSSNIGQNSRSIFDDVDT
jgi:hypothetical protein